MIFFFSAKIQASETTLKINIFGDTHICFPSGPVVKNLPAMQETREAPVQSLGGMILWRRKWQPTPVFLPGKFHGQSSLTGYSPWGHRESDTTEQVSMHTHPVFSAPRVEKTVLSSHIFHTLAEII